MAVLPPCRPGLGPGADCWRSRHALFPRWDWKGRAKLRWPQEPGRTDGPAQTFSTVQLKITHGEIENHSWWNRKSTMVGQVDFAIGCSNRIWRERPGRADWTTGCGDGTVVPSPHHSNARRPAQGGARTATGDLRGWRADCDGRPARVARGLRRPAQGGARIEAICAAACAAWRHVPVDPFRPSPSLSPPCGGNRPYGGTWPCGKRRAAPERLAGRPRGARARWG